jgi:hypothetical protein
MTKQEALEMMKVAPRDEFKRSKINAGLTQKQALEIIERGVMSLPDDKPLDAMYEKRVHQVCKNQKRPKY